MTDLINDVTAALKEAVAERGEDYVYPKQYGCTYSTTSGEPSCGVGLMISKLDPAMFEQVVELELRAGESWPVVRFFGHGELGPRPASFPGQSELTGDDVQLLSDALETFQSLQDHGANWGEALRCYLDVLEGAQSKDEALAPVYSVSFT